MAFNNIDRLADKIGAASSWPTQIELWADILEDEDPLFNRESFIRRATAAWEENYQPPDIDDEIPY